MPRIAAPRPPAEPSSPEQKDRHRRILRAAARQGADKGLDRMQMHDVAKDAGVAIATLYRYFPSKTVLFTSLMGAQVERLADLRVDTVASGDPEEAVAALLLDAGRQLLSRPLLAHAMLQSNNATVAQEGSEEGITQPFIDLILSTAGIAHPTEEQRRVVRLLQATWYGVLISALNDHITTDQAEQDTQLACRLMLAEF